MMGDVGELQELHSEAPCHPELQNKAFPTHCKVVSNTGTHCSSKDCVLFKKKKRGIKLLQVEFDNTVIKTDCSYLLPLPYQQAQKRFWHLGETYIFPIVQAELLHARVAEICPFLGHTWWWQQINSGQLCCSALCTGACSDDLVEFIWPQGRINSTFRF